MSEENQATMAATEETCCAKKKCKCIHKILGLKGLASIYKALSVLLVLYIIYVVGTVWYVSITQGAPKGETALLSVQLILTYGFYALVLLTIARVLKTLKKIKHAVEHK